jgi:hypothetical protein
LYDVLNTETSSGQLTFIASLLLGDAPGTPTKPYLRVRVPDNDLGQSWVPNRFLGGAGFRADVVTGESFVAAKDLRGAWFRVEVIVIADPQDTARPYGVTGNSSKRGALTIAETVLNRIDANRSSLITPNVAQVVDLNTAYDETVYISSDGSYQATIEVAFKARFSSGNR